MFIVTNNATLERAKAKAAESRPDVAVQSYGKYMVEGSTGDYYNVTVSQFGRRVGVDCGCAAGQFGNECYHAAAALARHQTLPFAEAPAPARSQRLTDIERALRTIERAADRMTGDFEEMDVIFRAVRDARLSLEEYELELLPAVEADAA